LSIKRRKHFLLNYWRKQNLYIGIGQDKNTLNETSLTI
jgi:hypothetical protein